MANSCGQGGVYIIGKSKNTPLILNRFNQSCRVFDLLDQPFASIVEQPCVVFFQLSHLFQNAIANGQLNLVSFFLSRENRNNRSMTILVTNLYQSMVIISNGNQASNVSFPFQVHRMAFISLNTNGFLTRFQRRRTF